MKHNELIGEGIADLLNAGIDPTTGKSTRGTMPETISEERCCYCGKPDPETRAGGGRAHKRCLFDAVEVKAAELRERPEFKERIRAIEDSQRITAEDLAIRINPID